MQGQKLILRRFEEESTVGRYSFIDYGNRRVSVEYFA